jgi:arylsulfatase A-like enzyme
LVAILGLVALAAGCTPGGPDDPGHPGAPTNGIPLPPRALSGHDVILITLDTVRADRLGCYGYDGAATPVLDGLAARGVRFTDAVTPVPITLPAHASILTGLLPPAHAVRLNGAHRLGPDATTLAELLRDAGYATGAVIAASVLEGSRGLDQGFDHYDDDIAGARSAERPAGEVTDRALTWLGGRATDRPVFLWVHYFDAHDPYQPPPPYAERFAGSPYDGEIAHVDAEIGRLLDGLAALGRPTTPLIVVTADHGEGLGEHGERTHAHLVYESTVHVPFIVVPGDRVTSPRVVDDRVVSLVDVAPTILTLLGRPVPEGLDGRSLVDDRPHSPPTEDRQVYVETLWPHLMHGWAPIRALRRHGDKYTDAPFPEYYDLSRDPDETTNLIAGAAPPSISELPEAAAGLRVDLDALVASHAAPHAPEAMDEETIERLQSLGYVMGEGSAPSPPQVVEPVPLSTMIETWQKRHDEVLASADLQRTNMIESQLRTLALTPHDPYAHHALGVAYMMGQRWPDATSSFERAVALDSTYVDAWLRLAECRGASNDWDGYRDAWATARSLAPDEYRLFVLEGRRLLAMGDRASAVDAFERAMELVPADQKGIVQRHLQRARSRN